MFLWPKPDPYREHCRDFWFRLGMRCFRKSKCPAVGGYPSPATRGFRCCPLSAFLCLRLGKILPKKVKLKYNLFVMKRLIPDPSEGLFNFQRLKCNYDYFSMPNLAHCPFPAMVAVCFERNSHAFLFFPKICIFIPKYRFNPFHKIINMIWGGETIPALTSTASVEVSSNLFLLEGVFSSFSCYMKCTKSMKL